jgi:hypothetical protein
MKACLLLYIPFSLAFNSAGQSLEGSWQGSFHESNPFSPKINIYKLDLSISLRPDGLYQITTYSELNDAKNMKIKVACNVAYTLINDSIYLDETNLLTEISPELVCFQKMALKIKAKKRVIELIGTYVYKPSIYCRNGRYGTIRFWKKN